MKPPTEFKVLRLRECPPGTNIETPEQAATYWRANIPQADWFDPAKEAFVVLVLNTRRRIIGHNLVTLGTLDTCTVHSREVFRPVIVAAGSVIVLMHNLCNAAHRLCYVQRRFMWSTRLKGLAFLRPSGRRECRGFA